METKMWIILLCYADADSGSVSTVIMRSAAEEVKENLTAVVGGNITLPDALMERGFLLYGTKLIASVNKKEFQIEEEFYTDKLYWNKKTGKFTIKNLKKNDSGVYNFDSKKGNIFLSSYHLTVYDSAPSPAVRRLKVNSDICLLECFVDKKTKLSWYKDEKILNQSISDLFLLQAVDKQNFNSSYRCVSANPAENKTRLVNIDKFCKDQDEAWMDDIKQRHYWIVAIIVGSILFLMVVLVTCKIKGKYLGQKRTIRQSQDSDQKEEEVQYTQIHIKTDRRSQGGSFPDPSGDTQRPNSLTTVYDKLEAHRMLPADPMENY